MPQGKGTYGKQVGRPPKKAYKKGGKAKKYKIGGKPAKGAYTRIDAFEVGEDAKESIDRKNNPNYDLFFKDYATKQEKARWKMSEKAYETDLGSTPGQPRGRRGAFHKDRQTLDEEIALKEERDYVRATHSEEELREMPAFKKEFEYQDTHTPLTGEDIKVAKDALKPRALQNEELSSKRRRRNKVDAPADALEPVYKEGGKVRKGQKGLKELQKKAKDAIKGDPGKQAAPEHIPASPADSDTYAHMATDARSRSKKEYI